MSGGIAYAHDPDGKLEGNSNMGLISITALDAEDAEVLRGMLERHATYTGSPKARGMLDDFEASLAAFVKVIPNAYRKALSLMKEASERDIPEEERILFAFNAVIAEKSDRVQEVAAGIV
jgi:glutamate synthase domain-containing protein 3